MPALFIIAAVILLLVAAAVRNALAVVLACGCGLAVWTATPDLPATRTVAPGGRRIAVTSRADDQPCRQRPSLRLRHPQRSHACSFMAAMARLR